MAYGLFVPMKGALEAVNDRPVAPHEEMDRRQEIANEFYVVTGAEVAPFVSDQAKWFDFDYLGTEELLGRVEAYFGVRLDEQQLRLPFWRLLDHLQEHRRQ
jgi:hypothetical protein